ncbi:hypothetical protein C8J56DRAFT_886572 [Mycena floridula]|nr:hypothetical protein C8J56DRAFT_886572 [Mycena floridula]
MRSFTAIALISSAATVFGASHQARNHNEVAKRMEGTLSKRATFNNKRFTWYGTDTGPDACTGKNHQDSDWYVAMAIGQFGDGKACCGRQLTLSYNGKSTVATCVDACASCYNVGELDLTRGLFQFFASLDTGVFDGSWSYADEGDDNDDQDNQPTTTQKPHTTAKTEPKPTTTPAVVEKVVKKTSSTTKKSSTTQKHSSTVKPSSTPEPSSTKASSTLSPTLAVETPTPTPTPTPTEVVGNAGSSAGDTSGIAGGIAAGSSNGADRRGLSKVVAGAAALALFAAL